MTPRRRWTFGALATIAVLLLGVGAGRWQVIAWIGDLPPYSHDFGEREVQRVAMRDGARLTTQIYRPAGTGPWPTLLVRSPYNSFRSFETLCKLFTRYGYACVHQDARGRFASEGEWTPLRNERADGLDTLAWLTAQPWQDGNLALFGPSYLGVVQWAMADALPPEVKTIIPTVIGTDFYTMAYQNGVFRHEIATAWAAVMPDNEMRFENGGAYRDALTHRPMIEIDERFFGKRIPWFREMMTSQGSGDAFWQQAELVALHGVPERTTVPVLMVASWYGFFCGAQLDIFERLQSRAQSKLIVGPWSHVHRDFGDLDLPGSRDLGDQLRLLLDWLDHHLRGAPLAQPRGVVETYVINAGAWRTRPAWPPPTEPRRFFLGNLADAGRCDGGRLTATPPLESQRVTFTYDPNDPVPTRGGAGLLAFAIPGFGGVEPGSFDQGELCERPDVLSFLSEPLVAPLHLVGSVRVGLTVVSDAADTTFTAKLVQVTPSGAAFNIRDGITALSYRNGSPARLAYEPGTPITIELTLAPIEWLVPAGARLRLDVSSSNFPAYHPHANIAGPWAMQTETRIANQAILAGAEAEAFMELPLLVGP